MSPQIRTRRAPPPFRAGAVVGVEDRSAHLRRITVEGPELVGFEAPEPAASVRWLPARSGRLHLPEWTGNEFLDADGTRPPIRTLTPLAVEAAAGRMALEVVLHDEGPLSDWARTVEPGDRLALSGPGRGYEIDPSVERYVLAGDESALPALGQLLEVLPRSAGVEVDIELTRPDARLALPDHPGATIRWHDLPAGGRHGEALVPAIGALDLTGATRVWVAGEASAVQRVRRHLFEERGLSRSTTTVRGYWKHGRRGT